MRAKWIVPIALLASITIDAQQVPTTVTIGILPPTEFEDGSVLFEQDIETYHLYCDGAYIRDVPNDFTRRFTVTASELGAGTHECALSDRVGGIESVLSNTLSFSLGQRTPKAPTLVTVAGA